MRCIKAFLVLMLFPSFVWADGVLTPAANPPDATLYDYRSSMRVQDDFFAGAFANTNLGDLGWTTSGGTTASLAPEAGRPGIAQRSTSAASGTAAYTQLGTSNRTFLGSETYRFLYWVRLSQVDANTKARIGVQLSAADPSTAGVYFERLDADTNWFCVTRSASSETRTDTGVAASTSWIKLEFNKISATAVSFIVNGTPVCTSHALTNLPTGVLFPVNLLINSAASAKTMDFDYFEFEITGLNR